MNICIRLDTVLVLLLPLLGCARSQSDALTSGVVNGPTGISVEAVDGRQVTSIVNGPTGFSVAAEERRYNSDALYKEVEETLQNENEESNSQFVEDDVDLGNLANDDDDLAKRVVNGPTGSSVQQEELLKNSRGRISTDPKDNKGQIQIPEGYHVDTTDWSTDSSHWTFKAGEWEMIALPNKDHPTLPAPEIPGPALVVVTQEHLKKVYVSREVEGLSNVTLHYRYYLSEGEHPNGIPELKVYQVIDELHTTVLPVESTFGRWSDNTVPIPESNAKFKILFEGRLNKAGNEIAIDDITISAVREDDDGANNPENINTNKQPLPADTNSDNNAKDLEGTIDPEKEENANPEQSAITPEQTLVTEGAENVGELETKTPGDSANNTQKPEDIEIFQNVTDFVLEGNDTNYMVNGDGPTVLNNDSHASIIGNYTEDDVNITDFSNVGSSEFVTMGNDILEITELTDAPLYVPEKEEEAAVDTSASGHIESVNNTTVPSGLYNERPSNDSDLAETAENVTETSAIHGEVENNTTQPNSNHTEITAAEVDESLDNGTEVLNINQIDNSTSGVFSSLDNGTEGPSLNQTEIPSKVTTEGNLTEVENSTLLTNTTGLTEYNVTNILNNISSSSAVTTLSPINMNQTGPVGSSNPTNITESPTFNSTGGGINATDINHNVTMNVTTPDIFNPFDNATTNQGANSTANASPVIISSTSSPGYNGTTSGNFTGIGSISDSSGSTSWGAIKVFLVIGLLGLVILGFLYWRRQRRRDDEIPVFTRSSHADYRNPTFTDDEENFASRGTTHNYKSFD
ncbi:hypothetical protein SK128_020041 [Halocaridina rubra]|uniref:MAM domain-containing protein n=1 Tax=Halocaridina rubra TaxID=373956 RepID=A0AAN8WHV8_HALRR